MKQISKYYYVDKGMKFMITKVGLDDFQCRSAFMNYPDGVPKVPIAWVACGFVNEVPNNGKTK